MVPLTPHAQARAASVAAMTNAQERAAQVCMG
jgi:hypothetical protein